MATATVSVSTTVTPGVTLSNPVSLDELQLLGTPTVTVDSTADISGVVGMEEGFTIIVEADDTTDSTTNADALIAAVTKAEASGGSLLHPAVVLLMPGEYDMNGQTITINNDHVHIAGVTGNPYDVIVGNDGGTSTITVTTATNVHISGIYFREGVFTDSTAGAESNLVMKNCVWDNTVVGYTLPASGTTYFQIEDCVIDDAGRAANAHTLAGNVYNSRIGGSDDLYVADGVVVRQSIVAPTLDGAAAVNNKIYLCALVAALGGNITNDIAAPQNVVDSDVAI